ncbi:response regulator [Oxalobacteraceae bacterium CAVE-383]|nr:response regulator [Oxalobacteraceae bacterium CAVE-383]
MTEPALSSKPPDPGAGPGQRRILIIDDDVGLRELAQRSLKKKHYAVSAAGTLAEARGILSTACFDLLVIDHQLAETMTGLDFHDELRAQGSTVPILMCSGFSDDDHIAEARQRGVAHILPKSPAYLEELPQAILLVLESAGK